MGAQTVPRWEDLDRPTRERLDAQYIEELTRDCEPGLTDKGLRAYLDYRHERPGTQITTYEEGQIRRLLHGLRDPETVPDAVRQEDHRGRIETFGARWLHLTNFGTAVFIVVAHIWAGLLLALLLLNLWD